MNTTSLVPPDDQALTSGDLPVLEAPSDLDLPEGEKSENVSVPPISLSFGESGSGDTVMATQAIINRQAERLDTLKEDLKNINESLKSILDNDGELSQVEMELKEMSKKQKERKSRLTQSAESMQLKYKLKEVREQTKELEESLNNHLLNYYQLTGTKVFDTNAGGQREFRVTAKILGKKSKQDEK